jgi:pilus assembly protein CpaE
MAQDGIVAIIGSPELDRLVIEVAHHLAQPVAALLHVGIHDAASALQEAAVSPRYLLLDLGESRTGVVESIEAISLCCEPGTRVVAIGRINDIQFYRELTACGLPDYFPAPAIAENIVAAFKRQDAGTNLSTAPQAASATRNIPTRSGDVIAFMSAAGGDGASTAALNAAFALAEISGKSTILVDLDYQYGMAARNLNLSTQYGTRDLFEHPDRGIDTTIVQRMAARYGSLHVIAAPTDLRYLPMIDAGAITQLIQVLKLSYDIVILDLPHNWQPWVSSACRESMSFVLVAQLWLKSVTHAARILRAMRSENAIGNNVHLVINRAGAKFREGVDVKDFERVTGLQIAHMLSNDTKTVVSAENQAKTVIEVGENTRIKTDLENLARLITNQPLVSSDGVDVTSDSRGGLSQLLKRFSS